MSIVKTITKGGLGSLIKTSSSISRVIPIDATWYMPNVPKNGLDEFLNVGRLPNAAFFDLDKAALPNSKYPHMLPTTEVFNEYMKKLKVKNSDKLVVYDKSGIFSSPRAAWTLSLFGHQDVYLLNNYITYAETEPIETTKRDFVATTSVADEEYSSVNVEDLSSRYTDEVIEYEELLGLVKGRKLQEKYITLDARSTDRFTGEAPEPRPGLPSGHIPSAISLPFNKVLNTDTKTYKTRDELLELFSSEYGLDFTKPASFNGKSIIVMCGTGVTAVILKLAINSVIGSDINVRVYDGSWTEWAQRAPSEYIVKSA